MSAKLREQAEALREKYCSVFGCPKELVSITYTEMGDAIVEHAPMVGAVWPSWSVGSARSSGVDRGSK